MAELILSRAGSELGRRIAPEALARFGSQLGRAAGKRLGQAIDDAVFGQPARVEKPRTDDVRLQTSQEGASLPRIYGRARVAGQVIWAARVKEHVSEEEVGGGKGGGPVATIYRYTLSFAVGLCEGEIARIERVWANGAPLDIAAFAHRVHAGTEDQAVDPAIEAIEGDAVAPAYRGLAYVVFEDFPLDSFSYAIPQLSFEIVARQPREAQSLEGLARAVCLIPGSGEYVYATQPVARVLEPGREASENAQAEASRANLLVSLDRLQQDLPNVRTVSLVASWFGDDLRCGACTIRPKVETRDKQTRPLGWQAGGVTRLNALEVSRIDGAPALGGTPADRNVMDAIAELKRRGLAVGLNPFLLMDIPAANTLPDPYGGARQAAYPWRGRIVAESDAIGTSAASAQVADFFGDAQASAFASGPFGPIYTGGDAWRYRRFILHYAHLAEAAGGVDFFVIGSELVALTRVRGPDRSYPAVAALQLLARDVRTVLRPSTKIIYAADWSEYFGHQPQDGSGDVIFHLDPLWADEAIDAVAIDYYPPLTDWRDGLSHLDAADAAHPYDRDYLASRIEAGEGYDWFYPNASARDAQVRAAITDGAYAKPWVFRPKDLRRFWSEPHYDRIDGVESAAPTAWVPQSKPIWLNELGVPAIDKGANAPNLFLDPKSAESAAPRYSTGARDDLIQRRALEAYLDHWDQAQNNPVSEIYGAPMIDADRTCLWAWDARPFPHFPARSDVWSDGAAWRTGHWLNGRAGAAELSAVVAAICARVGVAADVSGLRGIVGGLVVETPTNPRAALEALMDAHGFFARERASVLVFAHDGDAPTMTLDADDAAGEFEIERADAADTPHQVRVRYLDAERDYRVATIAARRGAAIAGDGVLDLDLPLTLDAGQAEAIAAQTLLSASAATDTARIAVAPWRLDIEIGDRLDVSALGGPAGLFRVDGVKDEGARALSLTRIADGAPPTASGAAVGVSGPIPPAVQPRVLMLDLPPLPGAEADEHMLAAVYADPWPGAVDVFVGAPPTKRGRATHPAAIGALTAQLPPGPLGVWDDGGTLEVRMRDARFTSVDESAALAGANLVAVAHTSGEWELIAAREAVLIGPDLWRLRGLLRGLAGTERDEDAAIGASVIRVDAALSRIEIAAHEHGAELAAIAVPAGRRPSDPEAASLAFTPGDLWARPFAPAHARATTAADGALLVSWIRRARIGGDTWTGEPPLSEERELYRVEVIVAGVLARAAEVETTRFVYSAADQAADLAGRPVSSRTIRVAQLSTRFGAGRWAQVG
jgi:hypothetical protein